MSKCIKKELENEQAVIQCAERFGLVGDPTRMKICWLLCKHPELSVGEIADILNVSISVISHSLKKLRENDLVRSRRDFRTVYYQLTKSPFINVIKNQFK